MPRTKGWSSSAVNPELDAALAQLGNLQLADQNDRLVEPGAVHRQTAHIGGAAGREGSTVAGGGWRVAIGDFPARVSEVILAAAAFDVCGACAFPGSVRQDHGTTDGAIADAILTRRADLPVCAGTAPSA